MEIGNDSLSSKLEEVKRKVIRYLEIHQKEARKFGATDEGYSSGCEAAIELVKKITGREQAQHILQKSEEVYQKAETKEMKISILTVRFAVDRLLKLIDKKPI